MAAVAVGKIAGMLALTQEYLAALFRRKHQGAKLCALMGTIAKGLFTGTATAAEKIILACLQCYFCRFGVGYNGFIHAQSLVRTLQRA